MLTPIRLRTGLLQGFDINYGAEVGLSGAGDGHGLLLKLSSSCASALCPAGALANINAPDQQHAPAYGRTKTVSLVFSKSPDDVLNN
jgi:hypothetical protein